MELHAPIVAVTVHPGRARITRRGRVTLPAGGSEVVVPDLPGSLLEEAPPARSPPASSKLRRTGSRCKAEV